MRITQNDKYTIKEIIKDELEDFNATKDPNNKLDQQAASNAIISLGKPYIDWLRLKADEEKHIKRVEEARKKVSAKLKKLLPDNAYSSFDPYHRSSGDEWKAEDHIPSEILREERDKLRKLKGLIIIPQDRELEKLMLKTSSTDVAALIAQIVKQLTTSKK